MPSFLDEGNSTIFSAEADVLSLDPASHFGPAIGKKKVNEDSIGNTHPEAIKGTFDEGSSSSSSSARSSSSSSSTSRGSNLSDTKAIRSDENAARPTSMSSFTNGINGSGDDGTMIRPVAKNTSAIPNPPLDRENGKSPCEPNGASAVSLASPNSRRNGARSDPVFERRPRQEDAKPSQQVANGHPVSGELPSASGSQPQTNGQQASFVVQSLPGSDLVPPRSSPHRFSSPPAYHGSSPSSTSPSGHLQPPAAGSTLKQRHTLEVPKPPARSSKDGLDIGQASGRFSPTPTIPGHRRASLNLVRRTTRSMQSDAPRDGVLPDEDALRWAEAYRQKRASKRRRKEEEDDDRVLVGTKVDESHANWVTAYNMLTGIRVSVSRTNAKLDRELTSADFEAKQKSTFDITGNELVPSAKYDFKFKDYAPWVFRHLRALFRLDPADYLMSLTGKYILSELGSPGKSGSFFYFSRDYKYIIKTIHHAEHKFLRKILMDYYTHVQNNPNTLLSQFYGLHRVKMPYGKKIHFVIMNNIFPPHRDIHTIFDLKGSTIGRDYKEEDLEKNPRATLKDLNWLRRKQHLELGIKKKRLFLEQLRKDVVLLKKLQIMDYSLLIGIHDLSRGNEENLRDKTLQVFNPGGERVSAEEPPSVLLRTPSKMESVRKARELREKIRQERPVPIGQVLDKMPDELGDTHSRPGFVFNQDDGGFQATHEDNSLAEEVYYLGVIDCLTHYGLIKKIEHFWKGLSHDRSQISALPPEQYGDRFYNFVEGITMSAEEAKRQTLQKEREAIEANAPSEKPAMSKRNSGHKHSHGVPPMPNHLPPAPPVGASSPEAQETMDKAWKEVKKTESSGATEPDVPDRILTTLSAPDKRESLQHESVLPVVEEGAESNRNESSTFWSIPSRFKKGNSSTSLTPVQPAPPTPPKDRLSPSTFRLGSFEHERALKSKLSRESLNKNLPPLPGEHETQDSGVRLV